jgi:hypothetical protein
MILLPTNDILRGIYFDRSSDKDCFYVELMLIPLWVPQEYISFAFEPRRLNYLGSRNTRCHIWNVQSNDLDANLIAAIRDRALPFLISIQNTHDFLKFVKDGMGSLTPYYEEALAYGLAYVGDNEAELEALEELIGVIDVKYDWEQEILDRANLLKNQLIQAPQEEKKQLEIWKEKTIRDFKLESLYGLEKSKSVLQG